MYALMNLTNIKQIATMLSGFNDIPEANVKLFVIEAVTDLATRYDTAGVKETTYLYGIDEWTDLPQECLAVKRVFKNNEPYDDFIIENGKIKFDEEGEYKAELINLPLRFTSTTSYDFTLNLNPLYMYAVCYFVAYKETSRIFMHEDMTQGNNKMMLLAEYNKRAEEAHSKIRDMKRSRKRMKYADFM
jgi:hypothetical protein